MLCAVLATITFALTVASQRNIFGIGSYYPPVANATRIQHLTGSGGWATVLIPAGNISMESNLPPKCTNSGYNAETVLLGLYSRNINVVVRLEPLYNECFGGIGQPLRTLADNTSASFLTFHRVAATYARVADSLPRPPNGDPLRLYVGNELNLAWQCTCNDPNRNTPSCMDIDQIASEAASYQRDVIAALSTVGSLSIAVAPVAPMGARARQCCSNTSCPAADIVNVTSLEFERRSLAAVPALWKQADWFSSHAYPCAPPGCGLHGDPRPGTNGWNAPFSIAKEWLTIYRNETTLVRPGEAGKTFPVILTETGWCLDFCTEEERANWTMSAYSELWLPDTQVKAVTPFLLEGRQWWPKGFPWIAENGVTELPVFSQIRALRCKTVGGDDCQ